MGGFGWKCAKCTYYHHGPGTRCVMCDSLRVSKEEMRDFVMGKTIQQNKKESENTQVSSAAASANTSNDTRKENQHPQQQSASAASFAAPPSSSASTERPPMAAPVRNPYAKRPATTNSNTSTVQIPQSFHAQTALRPTTANNNNNNRAFGGDGMNPPAATASWQHHHQQQENSYVPRNIPQHASFVNNQGAVSASSTAMRATYQNPPPPAASSWQQENGYASRNVPQHASFVNNQGATAASTASSTALQATHRPQSAAAMSLQRPTSQHSNRGGPAYPSSASYPTNQQQQRPATSAGNRPASVPAYVTAPASAAEKPNQKPDIWTRSIRPTPIPYLPGPVPLCIETSHDWIYPIHKDYPIRDYQLEMSKTAISYNTLVSLPTGLGKTLIAAVVLYNYYRWFPTGKVLFLAPTLPLVHQQVKACYDIMGIPASDTAILTGKVGGNERKLLWEERRVFFCTPQTVQRDIDANRCPASLVVCVVLDEAHKASGAYAYTQVMEQLEVAQAKFRVLGLSATPGSEIKAIQKVIDALRITKIEARLDDDPGVKKYIHERHSEIIVVQQASAITGIERLLHNLIEPILDRLRQENALTHLRGNATLTPYCIIKAKEEYLRKYNNDRRLDCYFLTALKFVEIRGHLRRTGIGMVRSKMLAIQNQPQGLLQKIVKGKEFHDVLEAVLRASSDGTVNESAEDRMLNNPKLQKLNEILTEHFERSRACGESSRAIVFSQWRESVSEIVRVLSVSKPLLRPRHFVGQGRSSGGSKKGGSTVDQNCISLKGMKQSEQQQVIKEFQSGGHNVLVCTCIGEEGLDIGEVDLIVNYDTLRSPIRMIQRVGRTGRKRDGRVVCLVSEGAEEKTMRASKAAEKTLGRALKKPSVFTMAKNTPMFPKEPELRKMDMTFVASSFHMSQVGGHGPPMRRNDSNEVGNKRDSLDVGDSWRLTDAQEAKRRAIFGELNYVSCKDLKSSNGLFPRALTKRFQRARTRAMSSNSEESTFGYGTTRKILANFERKYGKTTEQTRRRTTGRSLREKDVLGRLFPFDPLRADERIDAFGRQRTPTSTRYEMNHRPKSPPLDEEQRQLDEQPEAQRSTSPSIPADPEIPIDEPAAQSLGEPARTEQLPAESAGNAYDALPENESDSAAADEFLLPTQSDSSSSDEDGASEAEAEEPALPPASRKETSSETIPHGVTLRELPDQANQQAGKGGEQPVSFNNNDEDDDIPLENLRLPTQESSSDDDSGDEMSGVEKDASNAAESEVNETTVHASNGSEVASSTDHDDKFHDLKDTPDSQLVGPGPSTAPTGSTVPPQQSTSSLLGDTKEGAEDPVNSGHSGFRSALSDETPIVNVKRSAKVRTDVLLTQAQSERASSRDSNTEDPAESNENMASADSKVNQTPARPPSGGDCLVDTPVQNTDAAESDDIVDDDVVCAVCFSGDSTETDPIVFCDGPNNDYSCALAVHKSCYPITICTDGMDHWQCDPCEAKQKSSTGVEAHCRLCGKEDGPLKLLSESDSTQWIHTYCQPWVDVTRPRICQVCCSPGAVSCSAGSCGTSAHPHCALSLLDKPWSAIRSSMGSESFIFCSDHGRDMRSLVREAGDDRWSAVDLPRYISLQSREIKMTTENAFLDDGDSDGERQEQPKRKRLKKKTIQKSESDGVDKAEESPDAEESVDEPDDAAFLEECDSDAEHQEQPKRKRLKKKAVQQSESDGSSKAEESPDADEPDDTAFLEEDDSDAEHQEQPKRKRLKKKAAQQSESDGSSKGEESPDADEPVDEPEVKRQRILERMRERHRGMLGCRFLANEAEIDSDEDVDGDEAEEEALRRIEEEEAFYNSFINDTSQLGAATQDALDHADESIAVHRAADTERERMHQFATPIFNRRMKKHSRRPHQNVPDSSSTHHEWDEPTPRSAPSSQKGLGNMHFIRSVIEHHRNGGEADEIEAFYHGIAGEENHLSEDEARPQRPRNPEKPIVMKYDASDSEDESDDEKAPADSKVAARPAAAGSGLSEEQRALIEAKRQEALRRRQQQLGRPS